MSAEPRTEELLYEVMQRAAYAMIASTCVVYLRPQCARCVMRRFGLGVADWIAENKDILYDNSPEEGIGRFMRQLVISAKEFTEEDMKSECDIKGAAPHPLEAMLITMPGDEDE